MIHAPKNAGAHIAKIDTTNFCPKKNTINEMLIHTDPSTPFDAAHPIC